MMLMCDFDTFAYACKFFTSNCRVNNGYGCTHSKQEETDFDNELGREHGKCYCHSCPLGIEADAECLESTNIVFDGFNDDEISEGEYLLVKMGVDASNEEKQAIISYQKRLNQYNLEYWPKLKALLEEYPDEPLSKILFRLEHPKTFAHVEANTTENRRCNRCGNVVLKETEEMVDEYPFVCTHCNENMFEIETTIGKAHGPDEFMALCHVSLNLDLDLDKTTSTER